MVVTRRRSMIQWLGAPGSPGAFPAHDDERNATPPHRGSPRGMEPMATIEIRSYSVKEVTAGAAQPLSLSSPVTGEVAERSKAAVLKTVGPHGPVGSNPTLSAIHTHLELWHHETGFSIHSSNLVRRVPEPRLEPPRCSGDRTRFVCTETPRDSAFVIHRHRRGITTPS